LWAFSRGQIEQEWLCAVEDNQDEAYFEPLRSEPQKMKELCEMKGVAFNLMDTDD